jgi:putative redox protein
VIDVVSERLQFSAPRRAKRLLPLQRPPGATRGGVLFVHCLPAGDDRYTMNRLSRGLAEAGYAVLRWDFTSLGEVPGVDIEPSATTTNDLQRAATLLAQQDIGSISLLAHGVASAAVLPMATSVRHLASVTTIGAPATARAVRQLFESPRGRANDEHAVSAIGRTFPLDAEVLEEFAAFERDRAVADLGAPLLVVHALDDEAVPVEEAEKLFAAAVQPKSFVPLMDADHLLRSPAAGEQALRVVADWLHRTRPPNLRQ